MAGLTVRYVREFLDKTLKGSATRFLDNENKKYPEVVRVA
jgi:hypothetical protein